METQALEGEGCTMWSTEPLDVRTNIYLNSSMFDISDFEGHPTMHGLRFDSHLVANTPNLSIGARIESENESESE